jgi:hypothetical protein
MRVPDAVYQLVGTFVFFVLVVLFCLAVARVSLLLGHVLHLI